MKKLNSIRKGISMLLSFLAANIVIAQELSFTQAIDSLLAPLDKSRISTGILYERVMPYTNLDLYNTPSENPPASNYYFFRQAYFELYKAAYNNSNWIKPEWLKTWADGEAYQGKYTVGVLDFQFNMIDSNAVNNGQLSFSNGQFYDVPGTPSPYWTKRVQMASILAEEIPGGQVSIRYNPNFVKTNLSVQISSISLNFGILGNYTLTPANTSVSINFTGSGIKEFNITINYTNGTSFSHASKVQVGDNTAPYTGRVSRITAPSPDVSFWISGKYPFQGYTESFAAYGKAQISIWWKLNSQNQPVPGIVKPVIIVDGIDALNTRPNTTIFDLFNYLDGNNYPQNFGQELRSKGFDIIVMDMPAYMRGAPGTINDPTSNLPYPTPLYDDILPDSLKNRGLIFGGADYIQRNAYVLEALIDYCNQQMALNGSNEKQVLVGPSMGGQITRYALRDMERRGQNHNCRLWVSFDSNHEGAYVPVGIQYSLDKLSNNSEEAKLIREAWVGSPTAKQTTIHHHLANSSSVNGAPGFYNRYYDEINNPSFGFPQAPGLRKLAMVSGSDLGIPQTFGTACQLATEFEVRYKPRGFLNWLTSFYVSTAGTLIGFAINPIIKHSTYLAPATGSCVSFKFHHFTQDDYTKGIFAPSWSNTSLDMLQGGFFPAFEEYRKSLDSVNEKKLYSFWQKFLSASVKDFIGNGVQQPTYSTLAIGLGSMPDPARKWDENFRKVHGSNLDVDVTCPESKESPFDMYWGPDINTRHDSLLLGHVVRLRREIIDGLEWPRTKYDRPLTIQPAATNPPYICPTDELTFTVNEPVPGLTYTWSFDNPSLWQLVSQPSPNTIVVKWLGGHNQGDNIMVNSESECFYLRGSYFASFYLASELPLQGHYIDATNTSYRLNFDQVNAVNGGYTQGQVSLLAVGSNYYFYTLLNNPATTYTWTQFRNQFTINAQPSFNPTNKIFQYRVDYAAPCNAGIRSRFFDMFFYEPRGRINNSQSSYVVEGNNLFINSTKNYPTENLMDIEIFDLSGRLIRRNKGFATGNRIRIDISGVANGIYVIKAFGKSTVITQKAFINK